MVPSMQNRSAGSFPEISYNESDQDANSALTELDKGLHSGRIGEQCQTIVRFPRLFEKYPFPILINSACLKLSEVFRIGSNFLRMLVLRVFQESEKHLDKILNVDEFVRRIFAVIYSNDPVARALTLRTLGSIACIVKDRTNVHHSVRTSLASRDVVELEAAIFAASRLAAHSAAFATSVCALVGDMMSRLSTPVDVKLSLLTVFQRMHHDAATAAQVRELCLNLLPTHPAEKFVVALLDVLTRLAAASVTHIPDQIQVLLQHLECDPRLAVRRQVLRDLCLLADDKRWAHLWTAEHCDALAKYAINTPYLGLKCQSIGVLISLSRSLAVHQMSLDSINEGVLAVAFENCYHEDVSVCSMAVQLLTHLAIFVHKERLQLKNGLDLKRDACVAVETLLLIVAAPNKHGNITEKVGNAALFSCLRCILALCRSDQELCANFVDILGCFLPDRLICQALCAIGAERRGVLVPLEENIQSLLPSQPLLLWTLWLQATVESSTPIHYPPQVLNNLDLWSVYRVARQAAHYGRHAVCAPLFESLANKVASEHLYFWLLCLAELSKAEISRDSAHYAKAVSNIKAGTTPQRSVKFHEDYIRVRAGCVVAAAQTHCACACVRTCPPPAIAATMAQQARDDQARYGRVVMQLRRSGREWRTLADQYGALHASSFDADINTLAHLLLLQQKCQVIAQAIERVSQYNQGLGAISAIIDVPPSHQATLSRDVEALATANVLLQTLEPDPNQPPSADSLTIERISTLLTLVDTLIDPPLNLPRFFFQTRQLTQIKLALSPQNVGQEPVVILGWQLSLRVEGVVQQSGTAPLKKVDKVRLTVSTVEGGVNLQEIVAPKNDYFQAQFLVALVQAGVHSIVVDTAVVDEAGEVWTTGPQASVRVKTHEDASGKRARI